MTRTAHRLVAAGLAAFSVAYLVAAFRIPDFALGVSVQPGTVPTVLGGLMLVLSVLLFCQRPAVPEAATPATAEPAEAPGPPAPPEATEPSEERRTSEATGTPVEPDRRTRDFLVVLGSMAGYALLLQPLGFLLVTALYLAVMTWYLGYRRHLVNAAVAIGVATGLYAGVAYGFGIALPAGPLPV